TVDVGDVTVHVVGVVQPVHHPRHTRDVLVVPGFAPVGVATVQVQVAGQVLRNMQCAAVGAGGRGAVGEPDDAALQVAVQITGACPCGCAHTPDLCGGHGYSSPQNSEQGGLVHSGRELFGERRHRQTRPVGQPVVSVVGVQAAQVVDVGTVGRLVPQPVGRFLVAVEVGARSHGGLLSGRGPTRPGRSPKQPAGQLGRAAEPG